MSFALLASVVLGVLSVLQATLNRKLAASCGLAPTAVLNMVVALCLSLAVLSLCVLRGPVGGILRVNFHPGLLTWWWLIPGLCGCAIVFGLPWAVEKLGALSVFVVLVASQMCASAGWDRLVEGVPLTSTKVVGALLALVSVVLVAWK